MFQDGQADKSDRVMRGVVRKNPNYAGQSADLHLPLFVDITHMRRTCAFLKGHYSDSHNISIEFSNLRSS